MRKNQKTRDSVKRRNPYVEAAIARKGGPMKDKREKRLKDRLRKELEGYHNG